MRFNPGEDDHHSNYARRNKPEDRFSKNAPRLLRLMFCLGIFSAVFPRNGEKQDEGWDHNDRHEEIVPCDDMQFALRNDSFRMHQQSFFTSQYEKNRKRPTNMGND